MDKAIPHTLGLDLVKQVEYFTKETLESFEEDFIWLDEILKTAKIAFQTSEIQTLPKTPSAKKRKGKKRKSDVPSFIRRSSVFPKSADQSLNDSYNAENVPPPRLNATRATRNLRSRQKADTNADISTCNTSVLRTRNQRNASARNNTYTEPELSPTKEIPESPVQKQQEQPPQLDEPKEDTAETKMDVSEDLVTKETEQSSPVVDKVLSPTEMEASPHPSVIPSPAKPAESSEVSAANSNPSECRVNNNSFVIETPSEAESALSLPVILSPAKIPTSDKPEAMDTDSGVTSDDKEQEKPQSENSEQSEAKTSSEADTEPDTGRPSSSSPSSDGEMNQPPRTRTRTRKQQPMPVVQLPAPCKESISSTTSAESSEAPARMTRSRMRTKQPATTKPVLVPVAANPSSETCDSAMTEDKPEEPRTRTRTRLQKRKSDDLEGKADSDTKRQCTESKPASEEKRRSARLSGKKSTAKESPEDADAENSDVDDADVTRTETWTVPSNLQTPSNMSSSRSFLTMNSSYLSANRTPSQKSYTLYKYIQQNNSFTGSAQKSGTQSRLNLLSGLGNIKSLLKRNQTPIKGTPKIGNNQEYLEQRKREFEEKRKKEQERLIKREELQKIKMEERKRKREERMRKVAESRQLRETKEQELKDKKNKKLEEKLSVTDRIREEKLREEREKLRLRLKKQQEAEERRNQEDEERAKKLRKQEEENQRHQAMLQRKKEYEEQERLRKLAEEKRKLEEQRERMLEAEKEKQNELERRRKFEEERERERLRLKEEREKEAARVRAEREQAQREKLRELEQERLKYEQQEAEKKELRDQYIAKILNPPSTVNSVAVAPLLSSSSAYQKEVAKPVGQNTSLNTSNKATSNHDSYQMTPKGGSCNNYDITELKSDDSTDEEDGPRKPIPKWAQGPELKISLLKQFYNPPNLDEIFLPIELPDLNELFVKKKSRFNRRTSSAVWDSPMLKSHIPVFN